MYLMNIPGGQALQKMKRRISWSSLLVVVSLVYHYSHAFLIPSGGSGSCACNAPPACPSQSVCRPPPPPPCPCARARSAGKMLDSASPLNSKELIANEDQSLLALSNREIRRSPMKKNDLRSEPPARSLHISTIAADTTTATTTAVDISVRPAGGMTIADGGATGPASLAPQTLTGATGVMMEGRGGNQRFTIEPVASSAEQPQPSSHSSPPSSSSATLRGSVVDGADSSKCNSQVLRKLIIENINEWNSAESKRAINAAAEHKFGGVVDVVCSRGHFSYVYSSALFCEASKGEMTCIAFRQGSSSPNGQFTSPSATTTTPIPNEATTSTASSSSVVANQ